MFFERCKNYCVAAAMADNGLFYMKESDFIDL